MDAERETGKVLSKGKIWNKRGEGKTEVTKVCLETSNNGC